VSVTRHQVPQDDSDPIATTIRTALTDSTVASFKKSICACLIILTTGLFLRPQRRIWIPVALITSLSVALGHYWHTLLDLL
jgi:hypothetical protein